MLNKLNTILLYICVTVVVSGAIVTVTPRSKGCESEKVVG